MKKKYNKNKKNNSIYFMGAGVLAAVLLIFFALQGNGKTAGDTQNTAVLPAGDVTILKSEITSTAKFYPVKVDDISMEVFAVKASDGTIRTAFNTCQVCYSSGRGYYKQQGNDLICQNCGNRFRLDQIEKIQGGCNPVPILKEDKTDDGTNIVISKEFLAQYKKLFLNWKDV
ncbi:hypothetical protein OXPF_07260 [Oxobacter pfennigii]|uniref:Membrane iron-sulfur containing protein FtrD-like domain-containing protein n=1 Tax=Oxobacter pfennigii TaxID=36849 RepID=A0A0P8WSC7_9CLOT|nr:DUF2318 domain-containing protein [Oxobacter pfennigii]KPU45493.1 hypothetical protein OXPF_07260 [Oxobacter pfennigii]